MSDSGASTRELLSLIYGASWLIAVACEIALLVVVLTVVRRHRPDAYRPLLLWAATSLGLGLVGRVAGFVTTRFMATGGIDAIIRIQAINALVGIAIHVALVALLIRGLVAIAQPRKVPAVEGMPPYR
jgi:hypothetical protein